MLWLGLACGKDEKDEAAESSCEQLCRRAGDADQACADADCVAQCEAEQPQCEPEYRAWVECMANVELLGCDLVAGQPIAFGGCEAESEALGSCLLMDPADTTGPGESSTSSSADDSLDTDSEPETDSGSESSDGGEPACDPLDASCLGCGEGTCTAPEVCCWGDPEPICGTSGSCADPLESACDGDEDCDGGFCCVEFIVTEDGSASEGVSACASNGCEVGGGSTGSDWRVESFSCRSSSDCTGLTDEFGVPVGQCCRSSDFGVGGCVSETFADSIASAGGSCN